MVSKGLAARESENFKKCLRGEKISMPLATDTLRYLNLDPWSAPYFKFIIEWLAISDKFLTAAQLADKVLGPRPTPWMLTQAAKWTFKNLTCIHSVAEDLVIPRLMEIIRSLFTVKSNASKTFPSGADIILLYCRYGGRDSDLKAHVRGMYGEAITKLRDPYASFGGKDRFLDPDGHGKDPVLVYFVDGVEKYVQEYISQPIVMRRI